MAGKKKNYGKLFEKNIMDSMPDTIFCYKLRDSSGAWSNKDNKSRFTPTNYCDFIIFDSQDLFMAEAKSTQGKSLPFGNIKKSQIDGAKSVLEKDIPHLHTVFMVEFRDTDDVFLINSSDIVEFMETADRKSFPLDFFTDKAIRIDRRNKRGKKLNIEESFEKYLN